MTESEFETRYLLASKMTKEELERLGLFAVPCDCGEDCDGWAMLTRLTVKDHCNLYIKD